VIVAIIFGTTSFIACSLALYKLGRSNEYLNMLAFFGCIKLSRPSDSRCLGLVWVQRPRDYFVPIIGTPQHTPGFAHRVVS
jgi:hypothetical protein